MILGETTLAGQIEEGTAQLAGDESVLHEFISLLDTFDFWFNIVTP